MSNLGVLVVGASIAGPTAAYWLAKTGAHVTVIERFPELRRGGQNIDIRTVGVTVMRKMKGMEPAVRAALHDIEGLAFVRQDGKPIAIMKSTGDPDAQSLLSEYEILRGNLSRVIYDLTKDNERVKYIFGEQVVSIEQREDDGPVMVEFANGTAPAEYDLVVACDGATSRTRAMGFGCGVRDHVLPFNSWAAWFTIKEDLLEGSKIGKGYSGIGGRFVALGWSPNGGTKVVLMGIKPRDGSDATAEFRQASKKGEGALKSYIAKEFRGAGWKADELLDGMATSDDFYASEMVQVKLPQLQKGRFVVVGDAGYAPGPIGTGTSMALAGAYVLAGEIGKHKGDVAAGLRSYEDRMKPIIDDLQKIPPGVPNIMAPQTAWRIELRNYIFVLLCWLMKFQWLFAWMSGLFASSFGKDKSNLPDYEWEF
ncbi:Uncharacterized protein C8034_v000020 [Colletotrichum sidae]|uniref:FAD-binding domain-containing protein n=1 Tax=Colletotrichum sidae TaxID=1347389 RepID=A0A4R8SMH3_9PEZI|nr:Uncharacterized protein C8034_v000020 [Colletotrichum sidae]